MSKRSRSTSICSCALAALIGLTARASWAEHAKEGFLVAMKANASTCIDESLPPAKRIPSCTRILDLATEQAASGAILTRLAAVIYVARANALHELGDDQGALEDLNAATKEDTKNELPWLALGNFYMKKSDYGRALENYERAQKLAPQDPVIYDDRGAALVLLRRNEEAVADFNRALALNRADTSALSNRATVYLRTERPELAIVDLTEVIRAEPANTKAIYARGTAYEQRNALDQAVEDYRSAARLDPSFIPAYEALGEILARRDPQAALAEFGEAIRRDPQSPALRSRAILYLSLRQFEPALKDFDAAIANDGSDNITYLDRGVTEQQLGDLKDAIKDYTRSLELETTAPALIDRGSAYTRSGDPKKALTDFDAALAIEPKSLPALIGRADANYALSAEDPKRLAGSLKDYTQVIAAAPKYAAAYFVRGNVYFDLKEYAAAYSDYSESLTLDANQPAALFNRSLAAEHLGHSADAAKDRRAARELDASIDADATRTRAAAITTTRTEYASPRSAPDEPQVAFAAGRAAPTDASQLEHVTVQGHHPDERVCEKAAAVGSRIAHNRCYTQQQLDAARENKRLLIEQVQRWSGIGVMPSMCGGAMAGTGGSSCFGVSPFMSNMGGPGGPSPIP